MTGVVYVSVDDWITIAALVLGTTDATVRSIADLDLADSRGAGECRGTRSCCLDSGVDRPWHRRVAASCSCALSSSRFELACGSVIRAPTNEHAQVVADPFRSFGSPIFESGRARVKDVLHRFWAGDSLDESGRQATRGALLLPLEPEPQQSCDGRPLSRQPPTITNVCTEPGPFIYAVHQNKIERLAIRE